MSGALIKDVTICRAICCLQIQAETELVKASAEFSRNLQNMAGKSVEFEKQKLHDIKSIFLDFVTIEMGYHAKALEVLTSAYKSINTINEDTDLEVRNKLIAPE